MPTTPPSCSSTVSRCSNGPAAIGRFGTVKVKELDKIAGKVELKAGVHAFEVHQAVGDNPPTPGRCALMWTTPEQPKFTFLPTAAIAHPLYARVGGRRAGQRRARPAHFAQGIDDSLESAGLKLFLVRFEADGAFQGSEQDSVGFWRRRHRDADVPSRMSTSRMAIIRYP